VFFQNVSKDFQVICDDGLKRCLQDVPSILSMVANIKEIAKPLVTFLQLLN